jgi:2-isopropylmalate synthase
MEVRVDDAKTLFGVGVDADIIAASLKAIVSGLKRGRPQRAAGAQSAVQAA